MLAVCDMGYAKENRSEKQRDQQDICSSASVPRATLQGPAIPAGTTVMVDHWKA
jgi:hypothetical protein